MIEAEEGEDGGVEVVWADLVDDGFVAEFVGGTVGVSWAGTAACHPDGEGGGVVVASDEGHFATAAVFAHGGAAEFAAPDDEGIVEEAAAAEVGEEGVAGLVDAAAFVLEAVVEGFFASGTVAIPAPVEELDEADAAFGEASGEEAVIGEGFAAGLGAVEVVDFLGFGGEVEGVGGGELHAEGHFVLGDSGHGFRVACFCGGACIDGGEGVEAEAAELAVDALGVLEEENGFAG